VVIDRLQSQQVADQIVLVEIGGCDGCELDGSKLDVYFFCLFGDEGDVSEVTEEVVDAFDAQITGELEGHY
jgi:hypothetical protein